MSNKLTDTALDLLLIEKDLLYISLCIYLSKHGEAQL